MIFKNLFVIAFFISCSYASFQEVRIGKIDNYYKNKISEYELRNIIDEIEYELESQVNTNIFDYSEDGKDIDIIYLKPSKLEKRIEKLLQKIKTKQSKITKFQSFFLEKDEEIEELKNKFEIRNDKHNDKIIAFNNYVKNINNRNNLSSSEYKKIKKNIENEKYKLKKATIGLKREKSTLQRSISSFNNKILSYNNLIKEINRLNNELERMSRNFKKVKGMTFGQKEIRLKTFFKNGKKIQEKSVKNTTNKIEIYGFNDLSELKAVLAHEILHLVGIPHIDEENALMNPILQKNQLNSITLTNEDISNFNKNF